MIEITRRVEFDAGHRIPDHKSKCRNAHGHRYTLEATVRGDLIEKGSSQGMVTDFGDLKTIMMDAVGEPWDHAFLVWEKDAAMVNLLYGLGQEHKTVLTKNVPTVENLVVDAAHLIATMIVVRHLMVTLRHVRLYETPNCWADWYSLEKRSEL